MVEGVVSPGGAAAPARALVSVIIPAHDAEEYLAATIASALDQTYTPVEVIVVNDGSTDRTGTVAAGFGDRIRFIEQANAGPAAARNTALRPRRGELVGASTPTTSGSRSDSRAASTSSSAGPRSGWSPPTPT